MQLLINEELRTLIPPLQEEEFNLLEESIIKEGCRDSIITWNNTIIDGHNRYQICKANNIAFSTKEMDFDNIEDVKEWMINNQFSRRNLPLYQRAVLALKLKPIYEERALENKAKAIEKANYFNPNHNKESLSTTLPKTIDKPVIPVNTRKELSLQSGVGEGTISKVEAIEKKAPIETKQKLASGEMSINQAYNEIKKEDKKQKLELKKEEYNKKVASVENKNNDKRVDIFNTKEKFRIIYADPAWSYNDRQNTDKLGGAVKHYDTMTIKELSELPVKDITEDNAVLFIWVTSPLLEESFEVIKSWGFKYKTSFIWDKIKHNMGHYNSVRHEFLLIATKGSCTPDNKKLYDSVQSIERTRHSAKPKEFMDIIDDLYIYGERLEMFAREQHKEKWLYWGNEV